MIFFLDECEGCQGIFCDMKRFSDVVFFFFALFFEVSPLCLYALLKLLCHPEDVHSHIILFAVRNQQLEVILHLMCKGILSVFNFFDDGGDVDGSFDFLVVVWQCYRVNW